MLVYYEIRGVGMRLSNIGYHKIILGNNSDVEKIVFDKENQELNEKCDIGIVFGGISMIPNRIEQAINLYKNSQINKILVSGGIGFLNVDRNNPEAIQMQEYLLSKGISKNDILVEDKSRNTHENIKFSFKLLEETYNLNNLKLALITSDFHIRRCIALAQANYIEKKLHGCGVKDGVTDLEHWKLSMYGKKLILTEALLLSYYAKQKLIEDLEIGELSLKRTLNNKEY